MSTQTHPGLNQAGVGWWLTFEFGRKRAGVRGAGSGGPALTSPTPYDIWGRGNFNLNLSLPDSGWLRLAVKIFGVWIEKEKHITSQL